MLISERYISKFIKKLKQFIGDRLISKSINKVRQYIPSFDRIIKKLEYKRELYRYPNKMIGRNVTINPINQKTDVLVFAAHPDDDILGLGVTLYRHSLNGDEIKVIFVTNGTAGAGESWYRKIDKSNKRATLRYREAIQALSQINISKENIYCLGFPDGGTQRYLDTMYIDISMLLQQLNPKRVYVHSIEGGHIDHDMTSFVVKSICNKIGYTNVFEYTEYNPSQPIGTQNIRFLNNPTNKLNEVIIDISEEERDLKKKMLAFHQSQGVEKYFLQGEAIRQADISKSELELYEHCQLSRRCLAPIINKFLDSISVVAFLHSFLYNIILIS
ncbi:PIG-L deacetylase family protein [Bacillus sp. S/N-304-OC-R1]|uniref:PIG-L deacetylase family protein n=1 Tax=Bacillus sp. S/N-304-OC-R1 TaxID=2758034 RepID=UPI001C8D6DF3|nr:PIG-L family deacetylase [Bacillus sp. S/N-304-OC-R1]MBY0124250.1 PIG-L family deacetylase [Bacillus sp. S/N-304-OC-R1]